jgi:hypothetical protein
MTTHQDMVYSMGGVPAVGSLPATTGNYYFVDSAIGSNSNAGTKITAPLATIDAAIGKCTASNGDVIVVSPGHTETIAGATTLAMDVAGVHIIGLGTGSLRPTLTYSATASIINITAANCTLENVLIIGDVDNIVTGIALSAAADGTTLRNVEMRDGAANKEFLIAISIAAGCTDVTIDGFKFHGLAGGMTECILLVGAADRFTLINSFIRCDASAQVVDGAAAASVGVRLENNRMINIDTAAGLGVAFNNSSTGFLYNNHMANLKDTVAPFTGTGLAYSQNYGTNALNASGIILPAVDS